MENVTEIKTKIYLIFTLLLILFPFGSLAKTFEDLYVAEVLVPNETSRELLAGSRAGLAQVLVRVSGSRAIQENKVIVEALNKSDSYYYQYGYESSDELIFFEGDLTRALKLRLSYEPSVIAELLRRADLPVWGSNRPEVMVWLAYMENRERYILDEASGSELLSFLKSRASERGISLLFPILDLTDTSRISVPEIWGQFHEKVETASRRYAPEIILTGRLYNEPNQPVEGRWSHNGFGEWQSGEGVTSVAEDLLREIIDRLADDLASLYATDSAQGKVEVTVEGVNDFRKYAEINKYLKNLSPVVSSTLKYMEPNFSRFELRIEGQPEQLIEIVRLDGVLRIVKRSSGEDGALLVYKLED